LNQQKGLKDKKPGGKGGRDGSVVSHAKRGKGTKKIKKPGAETMKNRESAGNGGGYIKGSGDGLDWRSGEGSRTTMRNLQEKTKKKTT